jgi:hypothetical protein
VQYCFLGDSAVYLYISDLGLVFFREYQAKPTIPAALTTFPAICHCDTAVQRMHACSSNSLVHKISELLQR